MPGKLYAMRRLSGILFAIYLGLAPVYWLPGIEPDALRLLKLALFGVAVASVLFFNPDQARAVAYGPRFGLFTLACIFIAAAPGFAYAAPGEATAKVIDFLACFLTMWMGYCCTSLDCIYPPYLVRSYFIPAVLATIVCFDYVFGGIDVVGPMEYGSLPLEIGGFGAARTGWSNALALYVPAILVTCLATRLSRVRRILFFCFFLTILLAQYSSGGRNGLAASLLGVVVLLILSGALRRQSIVFLALALLMTILLIAINSNFDEVAPDVLSKFRLDRFISEPALWNALDSVSAGRLSLMDAAWGQFVRFPIGSGFGNGIFSADIGFTKVSAAQVHNLWMNILVEGGPVLLIAVLLLIFNIARALVITHFAATRARAIWVNADHLPLVNACLCAMFVQGVFISQFEPNALVGSFQATALWWAAAGSAVKAAQEWPNLTRSGQSIGAAVSNDNRG